MIFKKNTKTKLNNWNPEMKKYQTERIVDEQISNDFSKHLLVTKLLTNRTVFVINQLIH